ncbi:MAG TPA: hypothetical protein VKX46_04530, partial [Ktedonobacteraceae bacterium]|nr:hypothetical protein [Ktedonobacteraceae bacterium]
YLWGNGTAAEEDPESVSPTQLLRRLMACNFPLVRNGAISLLILHPELAPAVVEVLQSGEHEITEHLAVRTLATLYMQEWWFFRLTLALGRLPAFPETPFVALWEERHLPEPRVGYGREGLLALQEYQQQKYDAPLNFLDDWQNQINHLLNQEDAHQRELSEDLRQILIRRSRLLVERAS